MHKTIIADTSCFIILTNIGELELLHKVYGQIVTTPDIAIEYDEILPEWVEAYNYKYRMALAQLISFKAVSKFKFYNPLPEDNGNTKRKSYLCYLLISVRSIYRAETTEQTEKLSLLYSIAFHID